MNKELWERVELLEHDLKMLRSLNMWVQRYISCHREMAVSNEIVQIIATVDGIVANARTISEEELEELNGLAFDLEIPFAVAREARHNFTRKEAQRVEAAIRGLASTSEALIQRIEAELFATWEQIGKGSRL